MARCTRTHPRGWVCVTAPHIGAANEPCGLVPRWWNWTRFARRYRSR